MSTSRKDGHGSPCGAPHVLPLLPALPLVPAVSGGPVSPRVADLGPFTMPARFLLEHSDAWAMQRAGA